MSDILVRLREVAQDDNEYSGWRNLVKDALAEIERLQSGLEALQKASAFNHEKWMTRSKELSAVVDLCNGKATDPEYSCTVAFSSVQNLLSRLDTAAPTAADMETIRRDFQASCGHLWEKVGAVAEGDYCKRCGAKRPAGG